MPLLIFTAIVFFAIGYYCHYMFTADDVSNRSDHEIVRPTKEYQLQRPTDREKHY